MPSLLVHHIPRQTPGDQSHPDIPCKMWGGGRCGKTQERRATKLLFFLQPLVLPNFFSPLHPLFFSHSIASRPPPVIVNSSSPNASPSLHRNDPFSPTFYFHETYSLRLSQPCLSQVNGNQSSSVSRQVRYVCSPGIHIPFPAPLSSKPPPSLSIDSVNHERTGINQ